MLSDCRGWSHTRVCWLLVCPLMCADTGAYAQVDVEGYEAQVVKTAEKLLRRRCVHALQVELTRR